MDQETLKKLTAAIEFGQKHLQNPQDLTFWPSKNALAVADESNGLLIFSATGKYELLQHLKQCADAGSVCYNLVQKQLIVSVTKAISQGDDTPGELHFINDDYKLVQKVIVPQEPKVKYGYVRWVASDPLDGDVWVASGDNETAALWRYSVKEKTWKTVWKGAGDLEHPSFLAVKDAKSATLDLIVVRWTEHDDWAIQRWTIDRKKGEVQNQKRLEYTSQDIAEAWSAVADPDTGIIYSYDYKSGAIQSLAPPSYNKAGDVIGMTKCGQWTSMDAHGNFVYVSSSDERLIRGFAKRRQY